MVLASELFALASGVRCAGPDACHWCAAPCERLVPHDDPPPMIGVRRQACKRPGNAYVCLGCQRYRRSRVTVNFLGGGQQDRQKSEDHSWLFYRNSAYAVRPGCEEALYDVLLTPPLRFVLALRTKGANLLQLMVANDLVVIEADTPLAFTVDGAPGYYTVYELEEAARTGPEGKEPGVQTLFRLLGPPPTNLLKPRPLQEKRGKGRPKPKEDGKITKELVAASGMIVV